MAIIIVMLFNSNMEYIPYLQCHHVNLAFPLDLVSRALFALHVPQHQHPEQNYEKFNKY